MVKILPDSALPSTTAGQNHVEKQNFSVDNKGGIFWNTDLHFIWFLVRNNQNETSDEQKQILLLKTSANDICVLTLLSVNFIRMLQTTNILACKIIQINTNLLVANAGKPHTIFMFVSAYMAHITSEGLTPNLKFLVYLAPICLFVLSLYGS